MTNDKSLIQVMFKKIFEAASVLYDHNLSEEALCFYPSFLTLNIDFI